MVNVGCKETILTIDGEVCCGLLMSMCSNLATSSIASGHGLILFAGRVSSMKSCDKHCTRESIHIIAG